MTLLMLFRGKRTVTPTPPAPTPVSQGRGGGKRRRPPIQGPVREISLPPETFTFWLNVLLPLLHKHYHIPVNLKPTIDKGSIYIVSLAEAIAELMLLDDDEDDPLFTYGEIVMLNKLLEHDLI